MNQDNKTVRLSRDYFILVDTSESMKGNKTQALRPMAISLATRDVLAASAANVHIRYTGPQPDTKALPQPAGNTDLASELLHLLESELDAVFIVTDGYENTPSGRLADLLDLVRSIGITTPVFQVSPVMAAEAGGLRRLSKDISVLPVGAPKALRLGMLKVAFEKSLAQGVEALLKTTLALS